MSSWHRWQKPQVNSFPTCNPVEEEMLLKIIMRQEDLIQMTQTLVANDLPIPSNLWPVLEQLTKPYN